MLKIWEGGLGLFGGLLTGVLTAYVVLRRAGAHVPRMLDGAAPMIALAIGVGRIGDIMLTDHLGTPTTSQFALAYFVRPGDNLAPGFGPSPARVPGPGESCADVGSYFAGCGYHLTPVYDMVGVLALAAVLLLLRRRARYRSGTAAGIFGAWYGTQRLALDFTRGIDEQPVLGLTTAQLLSIVLILGSASVLAVIGIRGRGLLDEPGDPPSVLVPLLLRDSRRPRRRRDDRDRRPQDNVRPGRRERPGSATHGT